MAGNAVYRTKWWLNQRLRRLAFNSARGLALVGWRRSKGPATRAGISNRARGRPDSTVPVVFCVWRRPHRLRETVESLAAQSHPAIRLCVWNNNPSVRTLVDTALAGVGDVDVVHSTRNVGGFGRFYFARRIANEHPAVVFLDDDQVPGPEFVATLLRELTPETLRSTWGFRFRGTSHYWDRDAAAPGQRVKYCGTNGMICDTRVFLEPGLFRCPRRFWFVEDLWLSYYADHVLGWGLYKSGAEIVTEGDEHDQFRFLQASKDRLFRYLVGRGWDPVGAEPARTAEQPV